MRYEIVHLPAFSLKSRRLELTIDDVRGIENEIMTAPSAWPIMRATGGLRKMRYAPQKTSGGKSGGLRVCYFAIEPVKRIYLVTLFSKQEKDNLSKADCNAVATLITAIRKLEQKP
jgi:hypothetical protein